MTRRVSVGGVEIGGGAPLALIAGPCVIESRDNCLEIADALAKWSDEAGVPLIFKASYDKANRSSVSSFRGPGIDEGLAILAEVKNQYGLPVITDVHSEQEVPVAAAVVDALQLPAFLCRQTDLAVALGKAALPISVKKGQFLAPWDMKNVVEKITSTGNEDVFLTERGSSFGYNNLVADMRSIPVMQETGYPVVFDATHSVQLPGGEGDRSGGQAHMAPCLAKAAAAAGADGMFLETHVDRDRALCDQDNLVVIDDLKELWPVLCRIQKAVNG